MPENEAAKSDKLKRAKRKLLGGDGVEWGGVEHRMLTSQVYKHVRRDQSVQVTYNSLFN